MSDIISACEKTLADPMGQIVSGLQKKSMLHELACADVVIKENSTLKSRFEKIILEDANLMNKNCDLVKETSALRQEIDSLKAEEQKKDQLIESLIGFAVHDDRCNVNVYINPTEPACSCGLSMAIEAARAAGFKK